MYDTSYQRYVLKPVYSFIRHQKLGCWIKVRLFPWCVGWQERTDRTRHVTVG